MKLLRTGSILLAILTAGLSQSQAWIRPYEDAVSAAKGGKWAEARGLFMQASANRPEDSDKPTKLPGPITEQRLWRNGSPYSPNFLAAYCSLKASLAVADKDQQAKDLQSVSDEFMALVDRGQVSQESLYFLNVSMTKLGKQAELKALGEKLAKAGTKSTWRVDTEIVDPQELALARTDQEGSAPSKPATAGQSPVFTAGQINPVTGTPTEVPTANPSVSVITVPGATMIGMVPALANKYALVIGNSNSKLDGLAFAADDAATFKEALVSSAGYPDANVELLVNVSPEQIQERVKALSARMPDGATLLIYFAGTGANIGGKDYLAGPDAAGSDNPSGMVAKADVYKPFVAKGTRIFAFFQAHRPIKDGHFFGEEQPVFGAVSQTQATVPGGQALSTYRAGKAVGLYTDAFVGVLNDFRSNRIPIAEFGWQVFYRIRRGDTGTTSGGSQQTPTLPVLKNLAADARF